jgi:hypothetical protein
MAGYRVQLVATATAVTGSIAFIQTTNIGDDSHTVDDITFGPWKGVHVGISGDTDYSNISTNFVVGNDTIIQGPIYSFKSANTTGRFLVYYNT